MTADQIAKLPAEVRSAVASMACEGYEPAFTITPEEAEALVVTAKQEAAEMLDEFKRTGIVVPGPSYLKRPR